MPAALLIVLSGLDEGPQIKPPCGRNPPISVIGGLVSDTKKRLFVQEAMRRLNAPIAVVGVTGDRLEVGSFVQVGPTRVRRHRAVRSAHQACGRSAGNQPVI